MLTKTTGHSASQTHQLQREIIAFRPNLKAMGVRLTGSVDRADDLVQETMYRAIRHLDQFQHGTNLHAWLMTILKNCHASERRKRKRDVAWDPQYENDLYWSTGLQETSAEATHDLNRMLLYIGCLPIEQADALMAVGYLGMEYEEAAERLGCVVGTIKSRVNRARNLLFEYMEQNAHIQRLDLQYLKAATRGVPADHPYFPIAQAYEELFKNLQGIKEEGPVASKEEQQWMKLVASGVLEGEGPALDDLMRGDFDE